MLRERLGQRRREIDGVMARATADLGFSLLAALNCSIDHVES